MLPAAGDTTSIGLAACGRRVQGMVKPQERKERRAARRAQKEWSAAGDGDVAGQIMVESGDVAPVDDLCSAWEACKADGGVWGGRGKGGRGVARQQAGMSAAVRDVYVERLTLTVGGRELLSETPLRLMSGRCYALLGENGVGKSSLLHRICRDRRLVGRGTFR